MKITRVIPLTVFLASLLLGFRPQAALASEDARKEFTADIVRSQWWGFSQYKSKWSDAGISWDALP